VTAIVWLGAYLVGRDELGPGALVAFYGYAVFLAEQLRRTTTMVDQVTRALVASRQVIDFLTLKPALTWGQEKFPESPANAVLHDPEADLTVPAGRFVAVVCTSTADAHTVSDRLCRYGASQVTCGGQPLSAFPAEDVRRRVVLMDHRSRLFSGRLGSELDPVGHDDPGRLERALEAAAARDIVDALPDGLDQQITGSREFSGGQRQRLSLARVLALDPDTLILVEPTSALDAHTEGHIAQRLGPARTGKSTVVFTTSPILLDHVEHVIYMDQGRVVAQGSHDGLLDLDGYRTVVTRESALS
jgi:ABC-type multidrug transport system fused ATPase/permease subunit